MSDSTLNPAHPDVELLAEHAEELLPAEQSAELTAHLASCAECRETYDALVELTSLLGAEPTPGPMPEDVAARIDAALAAERAGDAQNAATDDTTSHDHVRKDAQAASVGSADSAAHDAAAQEAATQEGDEDSGAGRARPQRRPAGERPADNRPGNRAPRSTRIRRVLATLALFVAAGGIGLAVSRGGDLDSSGNSSASAEGGTSATAPSPKSLASSGYDFTETNLAGEVQQLASDSARLHAAGHAVGTAPSAPPSAASTPAATPSSTPFAATSPAGGGALVTPNGGAENTAGSPAQPTAPACVLAATKQPQPPAVQGLGQYLDVQVFALLYPDPADPAHTWDVYLVQNSCSAPLVLLHQSVPRG
ncbi:zf-HC2 domain-containing protein [Streptacidiphilus melanogenes]|uniref:zf-HC2 domain-containing protein n=1 Tax=Streptacidiphilus melanogenes TaxID=411235 RepID=UPI0005A81B35|nr:zf-HC2 domain-containing protein [Streptacidiphilus melanogenes]